jgi:hypothetical protein
MRSQAMIFGASGSEASGARRLLFPIVVIAKANQAIIGADPSAFAHACGHI